MERRVHVDPPQRFQTRISCFAVEAYFLHQELERWFPKRQESEMLLPLEQDEMDENASWLVFETDAPLSLKQRQFLTSCGLSIDGVELV